MMNTDSPNGSTFLAYGNLFYDEKNYDSALYWFNKTLDADEGLDDARYNIALIHYNQQQYDLSRKELLELLSVNPEYDDANVLMGDNFYTQNEFDSAIHWYEIGYSKGVRSAGLSHVMAYIYDEKNKVQLAIPLYQEAVGFDSTRSEIYTRLGELIPNESEKYNSLAQRYKN
jgi:tetratricopeptide (TPR) repeat protein